MSEPILNPFTKVTPVKDYAGVSLGGSSAVGDANGAVPQFSSVHHQWIENFAAKFFACAGCGNLAADPVIVKESNVAACRLCTNHLEPSEVSELPICFVQAAAELRGLLSNAGGSNHSARKTVKVRRTKLPTAASPGEQSKAYFHVVAGANGGDAGFVQHHHASPSAAVAQPPAPVAPFTAGGHDAQHLVHPTQFQGLNPNVELAAQKQQQQTCTPNKLQSGSAPTSRPSSAHKAAATQPQSSSIQRPLFPADDDDTNNVADNDRHTSRSGADASGAQQDQQELDLRGLEDDLASQEREFMKIEHRLQLTDLMDHAQQVFEETSTEERMALMDLAKLFKHEHRAKLSKMREGSKALKNKADEKYEASQYATAVELYTKAIEANATDGLTKLATLHGNRSAAYYMSGQYQEALDDCHRVLALDPESVKMYQRAAKCAVSLGDLEQAKDLFSKLPADKMTPSFTTEREKIHEGARVLEKAKKAMGSSDGDELWLMLVALYSEQSAFRLMCAEHFVLRKMYQRVIDTLSVLVGVHRTHQVAVVLAKAMYMCGFEHFERARTVLEPHRATASECAEWLQLINVVDDGKQQGNTLFSQKKFGDAATYYTKAINAAKGNDQILRILYCNRAAAYKELGRFREGVEDCTKAIQVDQQFTKAYARRARCHQLLHDHHAAIRDFKLAVKYDPADGDLADELRRAENLLAEEVKKEKDFYYVLGVTRTATEEQIRAKYKELALKWHPDKCMHMDAEEKVVAEHRFKNIGAAYHTLLDATKRREYDLKQDKERLARTSSYTSFFSGGANHHGGPTAPPHYSRYGAAGMPERRSHNFW